MLHARFRVPARPGPWQMEAVEHMNEGPDDSRLPLIERIPPPSVASPSDLRPRDAANVRWYRPTFAQAAWLLGWRWVYFVPAGLLLLLVAFASWHVWLLQLVLLWWKVMVIVVILPTTYAINLARPALRSRQEPFCIHCGYDLTGLGDNHVCPECGEPYTFRVIEEYKRDPEWFIKRYQMQQGLPPKELPFAAKASTRPRSRDGT